MKHAAEYLLRFDDLCPTMAREPWMQCEEVLHSFGVKPILAVVPDNRDPELEREAADESFWERMRGWATAGATIGLHGYQHVCMSRGRSLIPMHAATEFAGAAEETQRAWMHAGMVILRGHGLKPRLFVAPRHGFDGNTLRALRAEELLYLPVSATTVMRIPRPRRP